jgi:signal transduction histidine kinase/ligand-binding sensor domain-containing protein
MFALVPALILSASPRALRKGHGVPYKTVAEDAPFGRSARAQRLVGSELGLPGVHRLRRIVPLMLAILCCGPLWSQESVSTLEQLNHRAFRVSDGAPSVVQALAQTRDGTLWVGSGTGLFRFDGTSFVRYPGASDDPLPSMGVTALISSPDGGLWIGFRFGGICLLRDGQESCYGAQDGIPRGTVKRFAWDREGALWVAATGGVARIRGGRVEKFSSDLLSTANSAINSMVIDRSGNVWVSTNNAVVVRNGGELSFHVVAALGNGHNGYAQELAESPDGHVWFVENRSVTRLDPSTDSPRNRTFQLPERFSQLLFFDREGNAWFSTEAGVGRWGSRQLLADVQADATTAHVETMQTDLAPVVFLEDREQNIWTGNLLGMDQFSRGVVVRNLKLCLDGRNTFVAGDDGTLWAACYGNRLTIGHLFELRNGQIVSERQVPDFTAAYRDQTGTVWFAGPMALSHLEGDSIVTVPIPEQVRGSDVQTLARDAHGALWVSVVQHAVYQVSEGEWVAYGGLDAMPRGPAITETVDGRGGIWFGYPDNHIAHLRDKRVEVYGPADGVKVGNITAVYVTGDQVWAGGDFGLARFSSGRFVSIVSDPSCALNGASGIVGSQNGDLWLHAFNSITHLSRQEVERVIRDPAYRIRCEVFDYLDGIPGPAAPLRPTPSAVATSDGRLWFETQRGTVSIDTTHLMRNTLAPPVTIWSINSAGQRYPNRAVAIHLPAHTTNLRIDYSAGSYTVPERVRFRYKLEGSDPGWQDGGARREAIYTNLGPGDYRFQVIASNNDGIWINTGAAIDFAIAPAFYQTKWFYALCALLGFGVLATLYRLRIEQVRAQTSRLLAARLGERERIARELHDTLLQSMQGLIWQFQAATDRIPHGEPAHQLMEQSLERADKLLGEGRDKVKDLRAAGSDGSDLIHALAAEGEQLAVAQPAAFRLSVEGVPRDLHPIVREEAFLIAREALGNAFRHAAAKHIEVDVSYSESSLRVRVRDDGRGISTDLLTGGKPNRFGLVGMRERAKKLDAQLDIGSRPGAGTEVDLRIPAKVAFRGAARLLRSAGWRLSVWDARDQSRSDVAR